MRLLRAGLVNLSPGGPGLRPGDTMDPPARSWLIGARMPRKARPGIEKCRTWSAERRARLCRTRDAARRGLKGSASRRSTPRTCPRGRKMRRRPGAETKPRSDETRLHDNGADDEHSACNDHAYPSPLWGGWPSGGDSRARPGGVPLVSEQRAGDACRNAARHALRRKVIDGQKKTQTVASLE